MERIVELAGLNLTQNQTLSVCFVGPRVIQRINKQFENHEGLTDVISFDYRDESLGQFNDIVAELIVHPGMAVLAASKRKKSSFSSEVVLYLIHGVLHLVGENDLTPKERTRMRRKERTIIKKLHSEFSFESIFQRVQL